MEPDLKLFDCAHLPPHLREVVAPFRALAVALAARHPDGILGVTAERATALRKLLEAKDAAVRCAVLSASNG